LLSPLLRSPARASPVTPGSSDLRREAAGLQSPRPAAGWLLWRWVPIALALTPRLIRLRDRLSRHLPSADDDPTLLWAAVSIVLAPEPDSILLIRRAERTGDPWGGHMALPGGRQEREDPDLLATAIRETNEEVGIALARDHLAGTLDDVVPRTPVLPPIAVRPYVFVVPRRPALTPNVEVASTHWVTLDYLLRTGTHHTVRLEVGGQSRHVQAYELDEGIVWGMTERILTSLVQQLD
jgi:8-oxo-dGTP pyrophosphatase MutT (NUDIX family)